MGIFESFPIVDGVAQKFRVKGMDNTRLDDVVESLLATVRVASIERI